jgi:hypothetical protein
MTPNMKYTRDIIQKLKCGQNLFRKQSIEAMIKEVIELASSQGIDLETANHFVASVPVATSTEYTRPVLTNDEKYKAEQDAKALILKYGYGNVAKIIALLAVENVRLIKEIQEHRAARGIDPLPTFEV